MPRGPRKNKAAAPEDVILETPDITPEPEQPRAEPKPRRKQRRKKPVNDISPEAQEALHELVIVAAAAVTLAIPEGMQPTSEDVDNIFKPLERIYLRHAAIPVISPDVTDAVAALSGVFVYASHVRAGPIRFRRQRGGPAPNSAATSAPGSAAPGSSSANGSAAGANPSGGSAQDNAQAILAQLHAESYRDDPGADSEYEGVDF